MTHTRIAAALVLALAAGAPAHADEPGPGGSKPPVPRTGEEVYSMVCQACHMADARGAVGAGAFPALAANPRMAAPAYAITVTENGRGGMPGFRDTLTPTQTAEVLTYIRTHFGNAYAQPITAAAVEAARKPR